MSIVLGLGTNLGDRRKNLEEAIARIEQSLGRVIRIAPLYENPAMTLTGQYDSRNPQFLNSAIELDSAIAAEDLLAGIKKIERELGRRDAEKWSARPIDIDILLFNGEEYRSDGLQIPHAGINERSFVLAPLKELRPLIEVNGVSALRSYRHFNRHLPTFMHIYNASPDSFSDGGSEIPAFDSTAAIIDLGGVSTRPGAPLVSATDEWRRLEPLFAQFHQQFSGQRVRPKLSVDTFSAVTARRSIEWGCDMINDVSGLRDSQMLEVLADSEVEYVLTHSLGAPANPQRTMTSDRVASQIKSWFEGHLEKLEQRGIDLERVILDPGLGFGKTPQQSIQLLRDIEVFKDLPCRLLVGHSRKSFLAPKSEPVDRDLETVSVSLDLIRRGVDILRIHNLPWHQRAFLAEASIGEN